MRHRIAAAAGTFVFLVLVPGTIAGLGPWWMTGWRVRQPLPFGAPLRVVGAVLIVAGVVFLVHAFVQFVIEGIGTPAPIAPTEHLVVGGLYRHVRNPMYLAVTATLVGQGLLLGQTSLFVYAGACVLATMAFVRLYEEPTLRRRFGMEYDEYRRAVPGWWPRLRPWRPVGR